MEIAKNNSLYDTASSAIVSDDIAFADIAFATTSAASDKTTILSFLKVKTLVVRLSHQSPITQQSNTSKVLVISLLLMPIFEFML